MDGDRIEMSQRERDRLKIMASVLDGNLTQAKAASLLGVTDRTIRRWQRRLEAEGDIGVVHRLRGRPSNRRKNRQFRRQVLRICAKKYVGFGPTFASEKLADLGLPVGVETLRRWMIETKLWKPKKRRQKHRSRRPRRECFGELVQMDGSIHDWLEGRGEQMTLLVMIDDATSRVLAEFHPGETTEGYFHLLGKYLRKHGRMMGIYADRNTIFFAENGNGQPVLTQFGRAVKELGIELIPAYSAQAKGRVERFNGTAQDRLVKELRLAGASTIQDANRVLVDKFLPWFNRRCTVKPTNPNDVHRRIYPAMNLAAILSFQKERTVGNDYTFRLDNEIYQLLPPAQPGLRGGKVLVERRLDGALYVRFRGKYLKYEPATPAAPSGALPPDPRGLPPKRTTAEKEEGCAESAAQPSAVRSTARRSGCTPAEPCLPDSSQKNNAKEPYRPPPEHPWRKPFKRKRRSE